MIVVLVVVGKSSSSALSLFCCPPTDDDDDDDDDSSSTHPRLPQVEVVSVGNTASLFLLCVVNEYYSGGEGRKEYGSPKEKTHTQKKKKREREGLFLGFENFQKKNYLSFSPLLKKKKKLFLKNEETLFILGRERKTARRFLNHLSNHRIKSSSLSAVCKEERDKRR